MNHIRVKEIEEEYDTILDEWMSNHAEIDRLQDKQKQIVQRQHVLLKERQDIQRGNKL